MLLFRSIAIGAAILAVLAIPAIAIGDDGTPISNDAVAAALDNVPGVVDAANGVQASSDANSAVTATVQGGSVDIPVDPSSPITVSVNDGSSIGISIPGADHAAEAQSVANGIVAYSGAARDTTIVAQVITGASTAADLIPDFMSDPSMSAGDTSDSQSTDASSELSDTQESASIDTAAPLTTSTDSVVDSTNTTAGLSGIADQTVTATQADVPNSLATGAGLRLLAVISSSDGPSDYSFHLTVPDGASIVASDDGGYKIVNAQGVTAVTVLPAWARDANDEFVPTSYSLDGTTLTLHVELAGAAFPVIADPSLSITGEIALPFTGIPDSARLSGSRLVTGVVPTSGVLSQLGGVVYALAWPTSSTSDVNAIVSTARDFTPVAQGRLGTDGSFTLRISNTTDLKQFADNSGFITFDVLSIVGTAHFAGAFSREVNPDGSLSGDTPSLSLRSISSPTVSFSTMSSSAMSSAAKPCLLKKNRFKTWKWNYGEKPVSIYIYTCDSRGDHIVASRNLQNALTYALDAKFREAPDYWYDEFAFDLNKPIPTWVSVGETFTGNRITAKFVYRKTAESELGIGISDSGAIGGFSESGTKGIKSTWGANWSWTGANTYRTYDKRIGYQLREHWQIHNGGGNNEFVIYNTWNEIYPTGDSSGVHHVTPNSAPHTPNCAPVGNNDGSAVYWYRNSEKFRTFVKGANFQLPSFTDLKFSIGVVLSSQTGASEQAAVNYGFKTAGWLCGSNTGPAMAKRIQGVKHMPPYAHEWVPPGGGETT